MLAGAETKPEAEGVTVTTTLLSTTPSAGAVMAKSENEVPPKTVTGESTVRSLTLELVNVTSTSESGVTLSVTLPVALVPSLIEAGRTTATVGTKKLLVLDPTPLGVETEIGPVKAPTGTDALMLVSVRLEKVAATPLKATFVAPVKFEPPIVTEVPATPDTGSKDVTTGELVPTLGMTLSHVVPTDKLETNCVLLPPVCLKAKAATTAAAGSIADREVLPSLVGSTQRRLRRVSAL